MEWKGGGGTGCRIYTETTCFIRGKNKNIDRACQQTRTDAAEDFTGLKDVIPSLCLFNYRWQQVLLNEAFCTCSAGISQLLKDGFSKTTPIAARIWRKRALLKAPMFRL